MIVSLFVEYSKIIVLINTIYSNLENLVLWARSEKIGCAVNEFHGVLARPGATCLEFKADFSCLDKNN